MVETVKHLCAAHRWVTHICWEPGETRRSCSALCFIKTLGMKSRERWDVLHRFKRFGCDLSYMNAAYLLCWRSVQSRICFSKDVFCKRQICAVLCWLAAIVFPSTARFKLNWSNTALIQVWMGLELFDWHATVNWVPDKRLYFQWIPLDLDAF